MSNLFQDVLNDAQNVEQKLLGPGYKYYNQIKTPTELGMSSNGDLTTLANDINGLVQYVEVLVTGNGNASKTGRPLGNKFFMKTGAKCMAPNNQEVDRYVYVNNVPSKNVPLINNGMGVNFTQFKGLLPGTINDLNALNPFTLMQSFLLGSSPPCQEVTFETIDVNNNSSKETHYVTLVDLKNMDPCGMPGNVNNYTNPPKKCTESFSNKTLEPAEIKFPNDPIVQLYFAGLAYLGIYALVKMMEK